MYNPKARASKLGRYLVFNFSFLLGALFNEPKGKNGSGKGNTVGVIGGGGTSEILIEELLIDEDTLDIEGEDRDGKLRDTDCLLIDGEEG